MPVFTEIPSKADQKLSITVKKSATNGKYYAEIEQNNKVIEKSSLFHTEEAASMAAYWLINQQDTLR